MGCGPPRKNGRPVETARGRPVRAVPDEGARGRGSSAGTWRTQDRSAQGESRDSIRRGSQAMREADRFRGHALSVCNTRILSRATWPGSGKKLEHAVARLRQAPALADPRGHITLDEMIAIPVSWHVTVYGGIMNEPRTPQQGQHQQERFTPKDIPPFITAIAALITALVAAAGFFVGRATGAPTATPTATVTVTASPAAPVTSSVPGSLAPSDASSGEVLRKGQLTLTNGYCADLDSTVPNWSVSSDCATYGAINGNGDIRELDTDQGLYAPDNDDFAILNSSQPGTFATCDAATDYSTDIGTNSVIPGLRFCVRTTAGNFALMQVTNAQDDVNDVGLASVTFNVTVWKGSDNS